MILDFYSQTTQAKREWNEIFNMLKESIVSLEFCIEQNYLSKVRNKDFTKQTKIDFGQ